MEYIEQATGEHLEALLEMALDLWPDYEAGEMKETLLGILQSDKFRVLIYRVENEDAAFLYLGIRTDYVEGSDGSPTGYVEGIYVKPAYRRKGIARTLLKAGEKWLKDKGCTQIGSDIYLDNQVSRDFHTRMGFNEAGRLIAFIKDII